MEYGAPKRFTSTLSNWLMIQRCTRLQNGQRALTRSQPEIPHGNTSNEITEPRGKTPSSRMRSITYVYPRKSCIPSLAVL
jgi:hypothetical protein